MRLRLWLALAALAGIGTAAAGIGYLHSQGIAPRTLAPYIAKRSSGHNDLVTGSGTWVARTLTGLDRGAAESYPLPALVLGAQSRPAPEAEGMPRHVSTVEELRAAMASAQPGDVITLAPGNYAVRKKALDARRSGSAAQPIVVRAQQPGSVMIDVEILEGIVVAGPYWRFENLGLRGVCRNHGACDHAFHVVGGAHHFTALNNTLVDFNAHFKINGGRGEFPDHGRIEGNTLRNDSARKTHSPVTPIDLVAASDWLIRGNLIADFVKLGGDGISYGAFAKGAGARTVFERNVVLCEHRLRGARGLRIGLSLGGGGTGKPYCRDGRCITEQEEGVIRNNLIASCSDVGIYVNSGARSRIVHNTLLDTAGIDVRFPESSADVEGNLVDGGIRSRNGGQVRSQDNLATPVGLLYLGLHPQRGHFIEPGSLDLRWDGEAERRAVSESTPDLCGKARPAQAAYGAFEDFGACLAR
ncbi:MAG: right-handed parallel beta-helix repeat-containing protein [Pseudomonadota bacterium]